ncbi:MAG TPA: DMT family transporter [Gemmatimonadaceae bacterium]|nr:DMT family transporter [Gemmatimonadaceae bacterium]
MEVQNVSIGRATLLIIISAFSFGSISVLTVLITGAGVSLITAMAWRYAIAAFLLAAVCDLRQVRRLQRKQILQLLLIGGFGQALITYLSLRALDFIPVGPLAFLFYTYPAWVALLAAVRRTERLTPVRMFALALALIGVTIMVGGPMAERLNPIGVVLAVASALIYSAYLPALEHVQEGVPALISTFFLIAGAAVAFAIVALVKQDVHIPAQREVWTNIMILALVSTVIAFATLIKGLAVLGPVRTSIIATVEPFFTAILGVLVLRSQFTAATIIGGILIAGAIVTIEWSSAQLVSTPG